MCKSPLTALVIFLENTESKNSPLPCPSAAICDKSSVISLIAGLFVLSACFLTVMDALLNEVFAV
jgi:hypothetical protein